MTVLKSRSLVLVCALMVTACGPAPTRVMQLNPNTYTLIATSRDDSIGARQRALDEAGQHCRKRNLEFWALDGTSTQEEGLLVGMNYQHELNFQCLPEGVSTVTPMQTQIAAPIVSDSQAPVNVPERFSYR